MNRYGNKTRKRSENKRSSIQLTWRWIESIQVAYLRLLATLLLLLLLLSSFSVFRLFLALVKSMRWTAATAIKHETYSVVCCCCYLIRFGKINSIHDRSSAKQKKETISVDIYKYNNGTQKTETRKCCDVWNNITILFMVSWFRIWHTQILSAHFLSDAYLLEYLAFFHPSETKQQQQQRKNKTKRKRITRQWTIKW